jgi:hypothetical protein
MPTVRSQRDTTARGVKPRRREGSPYEWRRTRQGEARLEDERGWLKSVSTVRRQWGDSEGRQLAAWEGETWECGDDCTDQAAMVVDASG